jgi:hypothetical protein
MLFCFIFTSRKKFPGEGVQTLKTSPNMALSLGLATPDILSFAKFQGTSYFN